MSHQESNRERTERLRTEADPIPGPNPKPVWKEAPYDRETENDWKERVKVWEAQGGEESATAKFAPRPVRGERDPAETHAEWQQRVQEWQRNPKVAPPVDKTHLSQAERLQALIDELETTEGVGLTGAQYDALKANLESIVADRLGIRGDAAIDIPGPFWGESAPIPPSETNDQRDARMRKERIGRSTTERVEKSASR